MRQWCFNRKARVVFPEGAMILSFVKSTPEGLLREDVLDEGQGTPEGAVGWWRWKATRRAPTQRELNERLEQLFLSLAEAAEEKTEQAPAPEAVTSSRAALGYLTGLYLTRKRIVRQESGAFVHVKTQKRQPYNTEALSAEELTAAIGELLEIIA